MMFYIITLDSHEYFGPFANEAIAHRYMKARGYSTYQFIAKPPIGTLINNTAEYV